MADIYVVEKGPALIVEIGQPNLPATYTKTAEYVYGLLYTDSADLTGATLVTENMGTIVCAAGSLAWKKDYSGIYQYDGETAAWVALA